jgi:hypothetical protein
MGERKVRMRKVKTVCAVAVLAILAISSRGQAEISFTANSFSATGAPFDPPSYNLYYRSGAYAEATDDGYTAFDNQYDPPDDPWPGVGSLAATASVGGADAVASIRPGNVSWVAKAQLLAGHRSAVGYADLEHWIDFHTCDLTNTVTVSYIIAANLETAAPGEIAYANLQAWAKLDQWLDDDGDGAIDDGEWDTIHEEPFTYGRVLTDVESVDDEFSGTYAFDSFGPGTYSLGIGGWAETGVQAVPVPGALLLGAVGMSVAGWLCRRTV